MSRSSPLPFDDAWLTIKQHAHVLGEESVPLNESMGRILAQDVGSDMDMPPFNKSAMDGYACRRADFSHPLRVIETIPAGRAPQYEVGPDDCSKIMTGGPVPTGADCVVPVELTSRDGAFVRIAEAPNRDNICHQAEDIRAGDTVLARGTRIGPQHVGVLATVGCAQPLVARQPVVGVITTGDEIVEPVETPAPAQIRNSNGHQLRAQVTRAGALATYYGIVPDTEDALNQAIARAIAACDVLILSGGVSMGDFDLVPGALKQNGFDLLFEKVAVKPGRPTVFGVAAPAPPHAGIPTYCFGLPGNPVSTFVIFELFVRPFLELLMGRDVPPRAWTMRLASPVRTRHTGRDTWIPVAIAGPGCVQPVSYHGSGHLNALVHADGLVRLPRGTGELAKGATVDVRPV